METKNTPWLSTITIKQILIRGAWIVGLAWVAWLVSYSIEQYNEQEAGEWIFICNDEQCFRTVHIHSDIAFDLCGKTVNLPREKWPLDGLHTHKEKNYLHFHDKVDVNPETKENLFEQSLSLHEILEIFEIDPHTYCDTDQIDIYPTVNGEVPASWMEYNWHDGDDIVIHAVPKQ